MRITVLVPTITLTYVSGIQTFIQQLYNTGCADIIPLTEREFSSEFLDQFQVSSSIEKNDATIVSNCLYESADAELIAKYPRPRILYMHDHENLKHDNRNWIDKYIDVIAYDRPMVAMYMVTNYPGITIPYRELTLPYLYCSNYERKIKNSKKFVTHGRITPRKRIDLLVEAARKLEYLEFEIVGSTFGQSHTEELLTLSKDLSNVKFNFSERISDREIRESLRDASYYVGLTQDTTGFNMFGVEYSAMEAIESNCILVVNERMESEYRRQGVKAIYVNTEKEEDISVYLEAAYYGGEHQDFLENNCQFLRRKNKRFLNQLVGIIEEFECL